MPYSKHLPKVLTEIEIELIEKTIKKSENYPPTAMGNFLRSRDIFSFKLMFFTGLRPAECYQLKWQDIDFENNKIFVRPYINKRKNDLPAVLTKPAKRLLLEYKNIYEDLGIRIDWLFPSVWSWSAVSVCTMNTRLNKLLREAGLNKVERRDGRGKPIYTFNLYSFRHSFLTYVWKETHSDIATARLARHTQVQSASIYTHLCHEDKVELANEIFS